MIPGAARTYSSGSGRPSPARRPAHGPPRPVAPPTGRYWEQRSRSPAAVGPPNFGCGFAMAGGRGGPGRGRDEPPESYPQRQDHELQALEAIYGADFQDLRPDACGRVGTWLVGSELAYCGPTSLGVTSPGQARALSEPSLFPSLDFCSPLIPRDSTHAHFLYLHPHPLGGSPEPPPGRHSLTVFSPSRLLSLTSHCFSFPLTPYNVPASLQCCPCPPPRKLLNLIQQRIRKDPLHLGWALAQDQNSQVAPFGVLTTVKLLNSTSLPRYPHCVFRYGGTFLYLLLKYSYLSCNGEGVCRVGFFKWHLV